MESSYRLHYRPIIAEMLAEIPADTSEKEVRRLMRGRGPQYTSHLPRMWSKELNAQLDIRFDRARFKNLGPAVEAAANQLSLL